MNFRKRTKGRTGKEPSLRFAASICHQMAFHQRDCFFEGHTAPNSYH